MFEHQRCHKAIHHRTTGTGVKKSLPARSFNCHLQRASSILKWFCDFSQILPDNTRASPQWWLGRSTTAHIVLNLHSLIWELWRELYDCSLHYSTASQCIQKCVLLTFSSTSNPLAEIWNRDFSTPCLRGRRGSGMGPFDSSSWSAAQGITETKFKLLKIVI